MQVALILPEMVSRVAKKISPASGTCYSGALHMFRWSLHIHVMQILTRWWNIPFLSIDAQIDCCSSLLFNPCKNFSPSEKSQCNHVIHIQAWMLAKQSFIKMATNQQHYKSTTLRSPYRDGFKKITHDMVKSSGTNNKPPGVGLYNPSPDKVGMVHLAS